MKTTTAAKFLALVFTALALVPAGAHLFALPNKIALAQADYFTVQAIYRGWALFGIVLVGALATTLFLAVRLWQEGSAHRLAGAAFLLTLATLVVFFTWTWPANQATANWTVAPADWQSLRTQWEYAHAANALLAFAAFCLVAVACIRPSPAARPRG